MAEVDRLHKGLGSFARRIGIDPARAHTLVSRVRRVYNGAGLPNPNGYYVYLLLGSNGETLYVGQSTNIYSRLGDHLGNSEKRRDVKKVEVILCASKADMDWLEREAIDILRPPWNTIFNPDAAKIAA